ncbi:MAG: thioredoxin reductase [Chlamydiae bacterium SM23_39]|nr:MAG: thioredoxin reductase [Chlamydiae bacterium SM23_39]
MKKTKLVIIGSGPAGYTASIYTSRSNIQTILVEGFKSGPIGGQLMTTTLVENFPGFQDGIMGPVLMANMKKQALKFNTEAIEDDVISLNLSSHPYIVNLSKDKIETKAIIIATGSIARKLDIEGTEKFWQKGVSTCAVCDGASYLFRNQDIFVIGGGDSAMEEALFLTKFASKVHIVHRRDTFKASKILAERVMKNKKIDIFWNTELIKILGDDFVKELTLKNNKTNKEFNMKARGVFFAIGHIPNTKFLEGQLPLDSNGCIITEKKSSKTEKEGVFAAGDVSDPIYKQAIVAAGYGCIAAIDAERWLSKKGYI